MAIERWQPQRSPMPWQPFRMMDEFEKEFADIFGRARWPAWMGDSGRGVGAMAPKIDILEKEDRFIVKVELPGMKAEDIDISLSGDMLTIKGEKKSESETDEANYFQREMSYGSFVRSLRLPSNVNVDNISASSEDGILEIDLPKTGATGSKKIPTRTKKPEPAETKAKAAKTAPKAAKTAAPKAKKEAAK